MYVVSSNDMYKKTGLFIHIITTVVKDLYVCVCIYWYICCTTRPVVLVFEDIVRHLLLCFLDQNDQKLFRA